MLIIGADDRPGSNGRADAMMLGFADLKGGSVKLLSIPRDSYVEIPGYGFNKINTAYVLGKEDLTRQTVEKMTGLPIDYTVAVNMQGFQKIIDVVNGVEINVEEDMDYDDPFDDPPLHIHLQKGVQKLTGETALHYVRFRHDSQNDWGRMKRQQNLLKALVRELERPENLRRLPQLLQLGAANVRTNLSVGQLTGLARVAKDTLKEEGVTGATLAGDDLWVDGGYYLGLRFAEMRAKVRELAGQKPTAAESDRDAADAAAYLAALPKPAAPEPAPPTPPASAQAQPANKTESEQAATVPTPGVPAQHAGSPKPGTAPAGTPSAGLPAPAAPAPGTGVVVPGQPAPPAVPHPAPAPDTGPVPGGTAAPAQPHKH